VKIREAVAFDISILANSKDNQPATKTQLVSTKVSTKASTKASTKKTPQLTGAHKIAHTPNILCQKHNTKSKSKKHHPYLAQFKDTLAPIRAFFG